MGYPGYANKTKGINPLTTDKAPKRKAITVDTKICLRNDLDPSVVEPSVVGPAVLGASVVGPSEVGPSVLGSSVIVPPVEEFATSAPCPRGRTGSWFQKG